MMTGIEASSQHFPPHTAATFCVTCCEVTCSYRRGLAAAAFAEPIGDVILYLNDMNDR